MSLINDALKKAQKMRTQDPIVFGSPFPGRDEGPVAGRARPMSARWLAGMVTGAAVLVAGSVLATVFWLRKPAETPAPNPAGRAAAVSESPSPPTQNVASSPAPVLPPPATTPDVAVSVTAPVGPKTEIPPVTALPIVTTPHPESAPLPAALTSVPPASEIQAPPVASPEIRPAAPPAPAARFDARAQAFVDAMHVTGIRASGSDSKVLMNDRVYRLNDIVERSLGLRLTGVAADELSFTDGNGVIYTRNF